MDSTFPDELLRSPALKEHLDNRAFGDGGNGEWWVVLSKSNGDTVETKNGPLVGAPAERMKVLAIDMARALNKQLRCGGRWVVVCTHPKHRESGLILPDGWDYRRLTAVWLDQDGDPLFGIICDQGVEAMEAAGVDKWLRDGASAIIRAMDMKRDLIDPLPRQQFKAAQGEPAPEPTRH